MGVKVTAVDAESVTFEGPSGPERIEARTVIWAAGVQASPLARLLAEASGRRLRSRRPDRDPARLHPAEAPGGLRHR